MNDSTGETRPAIPADLRRRILVEAGHRCSIPTCRYIEVDIHHIVPWADCKSHEYDNLIALCPNCHRRADAGEIDRKSLKMYKFNLRFIHDKFSQLEMDVLFELGKLPEGHGLAWLPLNSLLLKRLFDSQYIQATGSGSGIFVGDVQLSQVYLVLTAKGRAFINELGVSEL